MFNWRYSGAALLHAFENVIYLTILLCSTLILLSKKAGAVAQQINPYLRLFIFDSLVPLQRPETFLLKNNLPDSAFLPEIMNIPIKMIIFLKNARSDRQKKTKN